MMPKTQTLIDGETIVREIEKALVIDQATQLIDEIHRDYDRLTNNISELLNNLQDYADLLVREQIK